jgi:hypothetical protein
VIICEIIVHLLVTVQNEKEKTKSSVYCAVRTESCTTIHVILVFKGLKIYKALFNASVPRYKNREGK